MAIIKRGSGRYQVRIDQRDSAGARKRRSLGTFRTKAEAKAAERSALEARDRGIDLSPKTVTVGELLDRYLADRELIGRGAKTLQEYRGCAERLLRPNLGGITIAKLRPARISEWIVTSLKSGGVKGRPLSGKTVYHAFALLNGALHWAMQSDLLAVNPCSKVKSRPSVPRSQAKALTSEEIARLIEAASGTRWEAFFVLALCLGARRGELAGLSWCDYDSENGTLTIRHSLSQTKRGVTLKGTKSDRTRSLPLSPLAVGALRTQRALQARERLTAGSAYGNSDAAIFTNELGVRITPMMATCAFDRIARKARISTTRLHDLRHTAATTLLLSGVDVRTVGHVLGHVDPSTTLRIYSHVMIDATKDAVKALGERLEWIVSRRS